MDLKTHKKRQTRLLCNLAKKAGGRTDVKLALSDIAPGLDIKGFAGGSRFVDCDNPRNEGGSGTAYDFNALRDQQLIEITYLRYEHGRLGDQIPKDPGIKITAEGFATAEESKRSWLARSIEKQPITFLQVIVALVVAAASGIGGFYLGRESAAGRARPTPVIDTGTNRAIDHSIQSPATTSEPTNNTDRPTPDDVLPVS